MARPVVSGNTDLAIPATAVPDFHGTDTIQPLGHATGPVIADTTNQGTPVSLAHRTMARPRNAAQPSIPAFPEHTTTCPIQGITRTGTVPQRMGLPSPAARTTPDTTARPDNAAPPGTHVQWDTHPIRMTQGITPIGIVSERVV